MKRIPLLAAALLLATTGLSAQDGLAKALNGFDRVMP